MNGSGLELVVQQGFGLVVLLLLPLVGAAAVSATAAGMLAARVGVQDTTVTLVARALAVVLAIGLTLDTLTSQTLAFTVGLWEQLAEVGRVGHT
jgi:flagellar biosynthesis protein FliQ